MIAPAESLGWGSAGHARGSGRIDRHQLLQLVLPLLQRRLLRAQVRLGGGRDGAARVQFALRHAAGTDQILGAPQGGGGGGELRLRLCHARLGAGNVAARRAECEIIDHGQALPSLDLLADHGVDRFDPAARRRHDMGQAQRVIGDDTGGRHLAHQRAQRRIRVMQLHIHQRAGGDTETGGQRRAAFCRFVRGGFCAGIGMGAMACIETDETGGDQRATREEQPPLTHAVAPRRSRRSQANKPPATWRAFGRQRIGKLRQQV